MTTLRHGVTDERAAPTAAPPAALDASRPSLGRILDHLRRLRDSFGGLTLYEQFEHAITLILTLLIVGIVASATWHLAVVVGTLILSDEVHPANQAIFQTVFGMIFTVIIALEFKHSLLIALARQESVVRLRSILLIAMLAMVRKFIILDLGATDSAEILALSAAILALGIVNWLVRDQDRRQHDRGAGVVTS